jgi:hypothetical protein
MVRYALVTGSNWLRKRVVQSRDFRRLLARYQADCRTKSNSIGCANATCMGKGNQ